MLWHTHESPSARGSQWRRATRNGRKCVACLGIVLLFFGNTFTTKNLQKRLLLCVGDILAILCKKYNIQPLLSCH